MEGPLHGLRVVDCTRGTAGPRATGMLADYGADVIWIEPPGGDPFRESLAVDYSVFNRNKRSVCLDLRSDAGRRHLRELLDTADVYFETGRPAQLHRHGLTRAEFRERYPGLIHTAITGFGLDHPLSEVAGYEAIVHAAVGTMGEQLGFREGPIFEALPFASVGTAYLSIIGTLASLYRRAEDGRGRDVETSLLDGALAYLSMQWGDTDAEPDQRSGFIANSYLIGGNTRLINGSFLCADGEYVGVHTGAVGAFGRLMQVLGLDVEIPPSETGIDMGLPLTSGQVQVLETNIHVIFAKEDLAYWIERLTAADVCAVPQMLPGAVFDEAQATHNNMVVRLDDPRLGPVDQVGLPAKFSTYREVQLTRAPRAGEHTAEVLAEWRQPGEGCWLATAGDADSAALLDGVKILDLGAFFAGPYASRLLADLGADVIKLETTAGDPMRGLTQLFRSAQAGKRSLAVNLKDPALAKALRDLIDWADVIHHNMRPGAAERLGVGFEQVRELHPDVVYGYSPGWGSTGPMAQRQSFEPMMSGFVGIGFEVAGSFNPPIYPAGNADPGNGLLGACSILISLLHKRRTGAGMYFENSQLNATMAHVAHVVRSASGEVLGAGRLDPLQYGFSALERLYEVADGYICLVAKADAHFAALAGVAGFEPLVGDRFATPDLRRQHDYELQQTLADVLSDRLAGNVVAELQAAGVPAVVPVPYNNNSFMRDPANRASGRVAEIAADGVGHVRELAVLVRISDNTRRPTGSRRASGSTPPTFFAVPGIAIVISTSFGYVVL